MHCEIKIPDDDASSKHGNESHKWIDNKCNTCSRFQYYNSNKN